jgi:Protein of unknown function (DUF2867)
MNEMKRRRRMRLPDSAHTARPWRIHELAGGFRVLDVWALPARGGPGDFDRLVRLMAAADLSHSSARVVRALWAIRLAAGSLFGWDQDRHPADNSKKPSLRERLPEDLRAGFAGPGRAGPVFTPLYLTGDEWAAEVVNKTVHAIMHVGWIGDGDGRYHGQLTVLVKPNGRFGSAYLAFINPPRRLIVYPAMIGQIGRAWDRG